MAATKAKKENSATNASAKPKPRGKPFTGKGDPRNGKGFDVRPEARNNNGQRSAAAVNFSRNIRELIVTVGEEITTLENGRRISKIEGVVRAAYNQAIAGDSAARLFIAERVEGKAAQQIDVTNSDGSLAPPNAVRIIPYVEDD